MVISIIEMMKANLYFTITMPGITEKVDTIPGTTTSTIKEFGHFLNISV